MMFLNQAFNEGNIITRPSVTLKFPTHRERYYFDAYLKMNWPNEMPMPRDFSTLDDLRLYGVQIHIKVLEK